MNIFNLLLLVLNLSASAINSKPSDAPVLHYSSLDENQITETAVSSSFDTDSFQYKYFRNLNSNPQSNNYFEGLGVSYNIVDTVLRNYISSTPNNNYFQVVSGAKANESFQAFGNYSKLLIHKLYLLL